MPLNPAPFTIFGIALALFLGFRNSASYDRFWEARKLWGSLLNNTRSLARQVLTFTTYPPQGEEVNVFINYLIAFTCTLKHELRNTDATGDLERLLHANTAYQISEAKYKPAMMLKEMALWVQQAKADGSVDTYMQVAIDSNLTRLSDILGGCERIASTPIPYTYQVLLHRTIYLYCFLLPFGLADSLGWLTPFIVVFIAYTFIAFETIAGEIEEPFGTEPNDLALNAMTRMIEDTLLEMAGNKMPIYEDTGGHVVD